MAKYAVRHDKTLERNSWLADGKFALGLFCGILLSIFAVLTITSSGEPDVHDYLSIVPIVISLVVASASSYFSALALREQKRTREAGTDPVLIAHLDRREDALELITFKISNVGSGAALNVCLEVEQPRDDLTDRNLIMDIFGSHHPFSVILQDTSIEFNFALGYDLLTPKPLSTFTARLHYEDLAGAKYSGNFEIDVRELSKLGAHTPPIVRIAKAVERIAKKG